MPKFEQAPAVKKNDEEEVDTSYIDFAEGKFNKGSEASVAETGQEAAAEGTTGEQGREELQTEAEAIRQSDLEKAAALAERIKSGNLEAASPENTSAPETIHTPAAVEQNGSAPEPTREEILTAERAKYQEEAETRAEIRNEKKNWLQKLNFLNRDVPLGMMQEEAKLIDEQIEKLKKDNPNLTNTEAMETVMADEKFGHKVTERIETEEEARKMGVEPDFLQALRKQDYRAIDDFWKKHQETTPPEERDWDAEQKMMDMAEKGKEKAFADGNIEAIQAICDTTGYQNKLWLKIPKEIAGDPRVQKAMTENMQFGLDFLQDGREQGFDDLLQSVESLQTRLNILKRAGISEESLNRGKFMEKAQKAMLKKLSEYSLTAEGCDKLLQAFEKTGLTANTESLKRNPEIHKRILKNIQERVKFTAERFGTQDIPKSLADYVKRGLVTEEEMKSIPALAQYV